jgi:hypothetical protein
LGARADRGHGGVPELIVRNTLIMPISAFYRADFETSFGLVKADDDGGCR